MKETKYAKVADILEVNSKHVLNVDKVKNSDLKVNQLKTGLGSRKSYNYKSVLSYTAAVLGQT